MGNVVTTFTSNDADVMKSYEKIKRENLKLIDQNKELARTSKDGSSQFAAMAADIGKQMIIAAGGVLTVSAAVGKLIDDYKDYRQHIRSATEETRDLNRELLKVVATQGGAGRAGEVERALSQIQGSTRERLNATFGAAGNVSPGSSTAILAEITKQAVGAERLGMDPEKLARNMAQMHDADPKRSINDIARIAKAAYTQAGEHAGEMGEQNYGRTLERMTKGGFSLEDAVSMTIDQFQRKEGTQALVRMSAKADEVMVRERPSQGHPLNKIQQAHNQMVAMDYKQRMEFALSNEYAAQDLAGVQGAARLKSDPAHLAQIRKQLDTYTDPNVGGSNAGIDTDLATKGKAIADAGKANISKNNRYYLNAQSFVDAMHDIRGDGFMDRLGGSMGHFPVMMGVHDGTDADKAKQYVRSSFNKSDQPQVMAIWEKFKDANKTGDELLKEIRDELKRGNTRGPNIPNPNNVEGP